MNAKKKTLSRVARERLTRLMVGGCVCVLMIILAAWHPPLIQQAHKEIYDIFLRWNSGGEPAPTPALIDIDEKSLKELGQWPWPRHLMGKLIGELTENGAASIGLDIILAEPDNTSIKNVQTAFKKHFNIDITLQNIPKSYHDNDSILAYMIQQSPVVLGTSVIFTGKTQDLTVDSPYLEGFVDEIPANAPNFRSRLFSGTSITLPLPELRQVAPLGMINSTTDSDGILRSIPLIAQVGDRTFIALSVRTLMQAIGKTNLHLLGNKDGLKALRVGKYTFPVNSEGLFNIPFRGGQGMYPTFSAVDILQKKIPSKDIAGRIFIIGSSAPGLLDIRATPLEVTYPGMETHAAVLDAILKKRFIEIPSWHTPLGKGLQILSILILGGLCTFLFGLTPAVVYLPLLIAFLSASFWGSWLIFKQGTYISPLHIMLTVSALAITLLAVRFWQESKQRRTLRQAFSRYIAPDMVERIVDKGNIVLAGEKRNITLMFTDIRNFTAISEQLSPEQVVDALNTYFTPMTAIIHNHQGTVDKFIGDAIMAFWNAPIDVENHELHAINSALEMQTALHSLREAFIQNFNIEIYIGIGIHTGDVYVGNMGSQELLDYTCIGDTVNMTSRLEGLCPVYGVDILTSHETVNRCQKIHSTQANIHIPYFLSLDLIQVKGKKEAVEIFTPISHEEKEQRQTEIHDFFAARRIYNAGKFAEAQKAFQRLCTQFPQKPIYNLYVSRCQRLYDNTPEDWDGIWAYMRK